MNTWSISSMVIQFFVYYFARVYELLKKKEES